MILVRRLGSALSNLTLKKLTLKREEPLQNEPLIRSYMPELDTIRGLAVLGVLLYHGLYWARDLSVYAPWQARIYQLASIGQFGVNLFFVLSGFLITGVLLNSRDRPRYFKQFYFRRALRILPAYYATLTALVLFKLTSTKFLLMSLAFSSNLAPLLGIALSYPVLWSLAVEEHFYLVWPIVAKRLAPKGLLWFLGTVIVFTPISRYLYHARAVAQGTVGSGYGFYTWNNLDGLALGAFVAVLVRRNGWGRRNMWRLAVLLIIFSFLIVLIGYPFGVLTRMTAVGDALQYVPWNFASCALIVAFILIGSGSYRWLVTPEPIMFLGIISYGLYLYHLMVFFAYERILHVAWVRNSLPISQWAQAWIRMFIVGSIAIALAYVSRRYLEEPFLKRKDPLSAGTAAPDNE
jgi:peptidoglycan/LPS O-acetylase OafA/YrhL